MAEEKEAEHAPLVYLNGVRVTVATKKRLKIRAIMDDTSVGVIIDQAIVDLLDKMDKADEDKHPYQDLQP